MEISHLMNFAKFYYNSNSSIQSLQGNVLKSTVEQIHQDKAFVNTGLRTSFLCFQHELGKNLSKWNHRYASKSTIDSTGSEGVDPAGMHSMPKQKLFFNSSYYQKKSFYSDLQSDKIEKVLLDESVLSEKNVQLDSNSYLIGIEEKRSKISGDFVCSSPKSASRLIKRKLIWAELNKLWLSNKKNRINGLILNPVNGGFAVAIAGYIAFLPRSLCVHKKVFVGQWRQFSIISMNSKIANIVIKEIKTNIFSENEKKRAKSHLYYA